MLVCTLPSPACMCRATKTRPRTTLAWISASLRKIGSSVLALKISDSGAIRSRLTDTRIRKSRMH